jgi:hypothetical protein
MIFYILKEDYKRVLWKGFLSMKIKVLFFAMICAPIYPSEGVKPWSWQHLKQVATQARSGQAIGVGESVTQAPHYSPWSWQHLKNLVGLAVVSRPGAEALAATHRRKFKEHMLQSEVDELEQLVDTNNPLWKNLENFDKHYEKTIKEDRPDRYVDPNLPADWVKHAEKALEERGINPRSVNFIQTNVPDDQEARAEIGYSVKQPSYLQRLWRPSHEVSVVPYLQFNQLSYSKYSENLADNDKQAILSHIAQHEATHFEQKHGISELKNRTYHDIQGTELRDNSARVAAQEKTADTLPTLKSREHAANALTTFKHIGGYRENKPDIQVQKSYWDVLYAQEQKDKLAKFAQQLQKRVQQHPINIAINRQTYNLMQRLRNTMPSRAALPAISASTRLPSKTSE